MIAENEYNTRTKELLKKTFGFGSPKELLSGFEFTLSFWILVASNLLTIGIALHEHWQNSDVLWLFWFQSVFIGIFSAAKIFSLNEFSTDGFTSNHVQLQPTQQTKVQTGVFLLFHYGFFHLIYAVFLAVHLGGPRLMVIGLTAVLFFINHLVSYFYNLSSLRQSKPNIGAMMFFPYLRIIPMHFTLILFGLASHSAATLVGFLLLKTLTDALAHLIEHRATTKLPQGSIA